MILSTNNALPPIPLDTLEKILALEAWMLPQEQTFVVTEHVLHAGVYARTVRLDPDTLIVGALIRVPTVVILQGHLWVFAGAWYEVTDYQVIPALAGRKQLFYSVGAATITMIFRTDAQTVEEAEAEFTEDADRLLSRRQERVCPA